MHVYSAGSSLLHFLREQLLWWHIYAHPVNRWKNVKSSRKLLSKQFLPSNTLKPSFFWSFPLLLDCEHGQHCVKLCFKSARNLKLTQRRLITVVDSIRVWPQAISTGSLSSVIECCVTYGLTSRDRISPRREIEEQSYKASTYSNRYENLTLLSNLHLNIIRLWI